ncbi:hypothetical protein LTR28_003774 [Elasticomyces elasticus]|nr:hypothetical protein LTR28_003774 [Elasticomyces elasticus]
MPTLRSATKRTSTDWRSIRLNGDSDPYIVNLYLRELQKTYPNLRISSKEIYAANSGQMAFRQYSPHDFGTTDLVVRDAKQTGTMALVATGPPLNFKLTWRYKDILENVPESEQSEAFAMAEQKHRDRLTD